MSWFSLTEILVVVGMWLLVIILKNGSNLGNLPREKV